MYGILDLLTWGVKIQHHLSALIPKGLHVPYGLKNVFRAVPFLPLRHWAAPGGGGVTTRGGVQEKCWISHGVMGFRAVSGMGWWLD